MIYYNPPKAPTEYRIEYCSSALTANPNSNDTSNSIDYGKYINNDGASFDNNIYNNDIGDLNPSQQQQPNQEQQPQYDSQNNSDNENPKYDIQEDKPSDNKSSDSQSSDSQSSNNQSSDNQSSDNKGTPQEVSGNASFADNIKNDASDIAKEIKDKVSDNEKGYDKNNVKPGDTNVDSILSGNNYNGSDTPAGKEVDKAIKEVQPRLMNSMFKFKYALAVLIVICTIGLIANPKVKGSKGRSRNKNNPSGEGSVADSMVSQGDNSKGSKRKSIFDLNGDGKVSTGEKVGLAALAGIILTLLFKKDKPKNNNNNTNDNNTNNNTNNDSSEKGDFYD